MSENFRRMIQLAEDTFAVHNDPEQIDVDQSVIEKLQEIHPASVSEWIEGDGPVVWILLIPTSKQVMQEFLSEMISEKRLLDLTIVGEIYDAVYLCSAMVLPEYRGKGLAKKMTLEAIEAISVNHPIKALYVWPFSREGEKLAEAISLLTKLPLHKRISKKIKTEDRL